MRALARRLVLAVLECITISIELFAVTVAGTLGVIAFLIVRTLDLIARR